jgi:hypothetical protein
MRRQVWSVPALVCLILFPYTLSWICYLYRIRSPSASYFYHIKEGKFVIWTSMRVNNERGIDWVA